MTKEDCLTTAKKRLKTYIRTGSSNEEEIDDTLDYISRDVVPDDPIALAHILSTSPGLFMMSNIEGGMTPADLVREIVVKQIWETLDGMVYEYG